MGTVMKHELDPSKPVTVTLLPHEWDALLRGKPYHELDHEEHNARVAARNKVWRQLQKQLQEQVRKALRIKPKTKLVQDLQPGDCFDWIGGSWHGPVEVVSNDVIGPKINRLVYEGSALLDHPTKRDMHPQYAVEMRLGSYE